jgi:long-chain fatty acid transport protein
MKIYSLTRIRTASAFVTGLFSCTAFASGFALQNQNGTGNGNAFAGAAATAENASTIFFNPAGMTYLPEGNSISLAATVLHRSIKFSDTGTLAVPTGFAVGSNGGDAGGTALIPAGYWSYAISPQLRVGLGISPTFGNKTEYQTDFIGRFSGYFADLKIINYNPSVAYKLNDTVSLGGGISYAKTDIEFRQMVAVGAATQREASLKGNGNAWGYNLGAMFQLAPETRVGVSYRSKIKFKLDGTQDIQGVLNRAINSQLDTPSTWSFALSRQLDSRWELLADATRTGWSSVQSLPVTNAATGALITSLDYKFKDTWRVGLGANYALNDAWKLRVGTAYDKSPVSGDADRTMTLPDSDRTWLSFGARVALSKASSLDLGYSHIFFKNAATTRAAVQGAPFGTQIIRGNFKASADLASVQYNISF